MWTRSQKIYNFAESIHIRSRCQWYEKGEKSSKFFLNLGKFNETQSQICKIIVSDKEITDPNQMQNEIRSHCKSLRVITSRFLANVQLS